VLHNQSALRLKGRLLFEPNVMVTSVPWQLNSSERLKTMQPQSAPAMHAEDLGLTVLTLTAGPAANGPVALHATTDGWCSCATRCPARWAGAGGFRRGSYWNAEVVEVVQPSADRVDSLCTIAGPDGSGCCDWPSPPGGGPRIKGAWWPTSSVGSAATRGRGGRADR
jgi:hypothetical protein